MKLYYRDPKTGEYKEERDAQLDRHGRPITDVLFAVPDAPGAARAGFAQVWVPDGSAGKYPAEALTLSAQGTGGSWYYIEDHRQHVNKQGVKEGGTEHWLPSAGDTWLSSPRFMEELGPLPEGAVTTRPEKPAEVVLSEARSESERRFGNVFTEIDEHKIRPLSAVLLAVSEQGNAALSTSAEGSPLDPDVDILWQLEQVAAENRELLAQARAASTLDEIRAIKPWRPDLLARTVVSSAKGGADEVPADVSGVAEGEAMASGVE